MKLLLHKSIRIVFVSLFVTYFVSSCMSPKNILYLQDMDENTQIELENKFEAIISPYDELSIWVTCYDQKLAAPFNIGGSANMMNNSNNNIGYLVDVNGNIQFPVLGEMHVAGMTRLEIQEYIASLLKIGGYIEDPYVRVRFSSFKIFFLGAEGGKSISIPNERCTFLEALALSGDLNVYTKRDKIAVMREVDGKMTMRYLDPRSSKVFNDPYFLLQQNDFIITESIRSKYYKDEVSYWLSWVSLITSVSSIVTLILVLTK